MDASAPLPQPSPLIGELTFDHPEMAERFADARSVRDLVVLAVSMRDGGDARGGRGVLETLARYAPDQPDVWVELLVIDLMTLGDHAHARQMADAAPESVRSERRVRLLRGVALLHVGALEAAAAELGRLGPDAFPDIPYFADMQRRLAADLLGRLASLVSSVVAPPPWPATAPPSAQLAPVVELLRRKLVDHTAIQDLPGALVQLLIAPDHNPWVFRALLASLTADTRPELRVSAFAMLCSILEPGRARAALLRLDRTAVDPSPTFAKWLAYYADFFQRPEAAAEADALAAAQLEQLEAGAPIASDALPKAALRRIEVAARRLHAIGAPPERFRTIGALPPTPQPARRPAQADAPPHIFLGFFGQLRHPEIALVDAYKLLIADLKALHPDAVISAGVATWSQQGVRLIARPISIAYVEERLPPELIGVIHALGLRTSGEFMDAFPAMFARLQPAPGPAMEVTPDQVAGFTGADVTADVADDAAYVSGPGRLVTDAHRDLNQGRMWNRIAALGPLAKAAEARAGLPISTAVLVRTDLAFAPDTTLQPYVREALAERGGDRVWVDFDPHAVFIEGLGDRYMVATPKAFRRIVDGERLQFAALTDPPEADRAYAERLGGHQFLNTILFEQGTRMTNVSNAVVRFIIFRNRLSLADLAAAVRADAQSSPSAQARRLLAPIVAALP